MDDFMLFSSQTLGSFQLLTRRAPVLLDLLMGKHV